MRAFLIAVLASCTTVQAIEPCAVEKQNYESSNNAIAASTVQLVEIRTALLSEKENHDSILQVNVKEAEARLYNSSQTLLQETDLLNLLNLSRPQVIRLAEALPRLSAFAALPEHASSALAINQVLQAQKASLDSEAVGDLQALIQVIRALEKSSRGWRQLVGSEPVHSLEQALEKVQLTHANLSATVSGGSSILAVNKGRITEAQNAVNASLTLRREKENQLLDLERRISLLRQKLPEQKAALHTCTRRAQFGE